ncbi:recombinase family protein [Microbacterium insulae]|uniref:Recombinase family protein n=1 Tax=Microbacterium insulae TaxID=483014 RepID=A0ABW3AHN5_9MICO
MRRLIGYLRPWWPGEDLTIDIETLAEAGAEVILTDAGVEGPLDDGSALRSLESGDILLVSSAARLGSSLPRVVQTIAELGRQGIALRSLNEPALSTDAGVADPAEVFATLEGLRRRLAGIRTRQGMLQAEAAGRRPGRPSVMTPDRVAVAAELRRQHRSIAHIARVIGVSPSAVQRALSVPV